MPADEIQYSDRYQDGDFEYRHVLLPPDIARMVPRTHLLSETEWRNLGVQQSPGWVHYMFHAPEPHVLLFRRPKPPKEDEGVDAALGTQGQGQSQENSQASQATSTTSTNAVVCV